MQLKRDETIGILHSFLQDHAKYANMEGFRRDSSVTYTKTQLKELTNHTILVTLFPNLSTSANICLTLATWFNCLELC